jgi:hypothetical protein
LVVKNQAIELATSVSRAFTENKGDGLLGLSFSSNNSVKPVPVATPVENMILQDDIPPSAELFTAWLGNKLESSFFTFGYIDEKALQGQQPTYTPLDNSQGAWMFESSVASINGEQYDRSDNKAMADTGTTLCLVGDFLCERIYSAIPGAMQSATQQGWIFPTPTDLSTLPKIALSVGNALFLIKPTDFAFQDLGDGTTYGGIQSRGNQDFDVLGCVFLRSIYAIFDQGNSRFGCTQRDLPPSCKPEVLSGDREKLHELTPLPMSGCTSRKSLKRRQTFKLLSCCFGDSREGSSSYQ